MKAELQTIYRLRAQAVLCLLLLMQTACKKFLDVKPDAKLAVPQTVQDVQALVDQYPTMNASFPNMAAESDDDFYMKDAYFNGSQVSIQKTYTWDKDAYNETGWGNLYKMVLSANLGLETLRKIDISSGIPAGYDQAKGSAYFFRGLAFYQLAQFYAKPYNAATEAATPGIPLRMNSDVNTPNIRNNMQETYDQVVSDLLQALLYLPNIGNPVSRPSRAACFALLADVYLTMGRYNKTRTMADSALMIKNNLLDYNSLNPALDIPFTQFNAEVVFAATLSGASRLNPTNLIVDSLLFLAYGQYDLRRTLFFKNLGTAQGYGFKGSYDATPYGQLFSGIAVDELYLLRAEAAARSGDKDAAIADINTLLLKRYKTGFFTPLTAATPTDALNQVLLERRKELVGRSRRWMDLRRFSYDPAFAKTLFRKVNGTIYELPPGDKRYTFYIPLNVVALTGMEQNIR